MNSDILPQSKDNFTNIQESVFEHFSSEDGFSQGGVFAIFQDSRGFMWFGGNGLIRYDGYNFKIFKYNPDDKKSLSYNGVISIYEDKSGTLWIGTEGGGLNKYNRETDLFTRYKHDPNDPKSLSNNTVTSILQDNSGNLWFGTNGGGLNKLIPSDSITSFIHYNSDPDDLTSLSNDFVGQICEDKSGNLWIATRNGVNKLDLDKINETTPTFIHYKHNPDDPKSLSHDAVFSVYEDNSGTLWIGTIGGGLNKLIPDDLEESTSFTHYINNPNEPKSLSSNMVGPIFEDKSGNLWIGTWGGGLNRFDRVTEKFTHCKSDPNNSKSLNGNWVYSIYEDISGILWVGTMPGGLNKFDPMKNQFKHYKHNLKDSKSLSSDRVWSIFEDSDGILWIGTFHGGLNRLIPGQDKKSSLSFFRYLHDPNDPKSINSVFSICEDNSGNIWIGTFNGGLHKLVKSEKKKSNPKFVDYEFDPNDTTSLSNNSIRVIFKDESGNLWIGTDFGLNKLISGTDEMFPATFVRYLNNPKDPASISNNRVWSIYQDEQETIWIGTSGGLNKLIPPDNNHSLTTFIHYTHDSGNPSSLSSNHVTSMHEDNYGNFWVGTDGGGLNKFDRKSEVFIRFNEGDGLPDNSIKGLLGDDEGNLWISTSNGLSKFNLKTKIFKNYSIKDGIQSDYFQGGAYFKNKNGEMFFGGDNGFNSFYPDSIKENIRIPPVVITDFQLFNNSVPVGLDTTTNRTILTRSITETNEIELTFKDYIISFEFAALDFHTPEKNQYAYLLEGFDKKWIYADANKRFATYTNLDPGEYIFKVKGSNNDRIWNEASTSIKLIITPPWWSTWWAYSLYVLFGLGLLYSLRRYELNRTQLKNQHKLDEVKLNEREETDKMKSRFFANISHEFRTPLTLILGPAENINRNTSIEEIEKQTNVIKRNAKRLLGLINQLLDLSKLEAGKLELKASRSNIVPFIKGVTMSFESMAERKDITLKVKSERDEIELYFDRDKMLKIMTNILSNAFKFTPNGGQITVALTLVPSPTGRGMSGGQGEGKVRIIVKDTGIGISEEELSKLFDRFYQVDSSQTREHEGTGIGLALTKELVELHHGIISVDSKLGNWTEFTVTLPVGRKHLKDQEIIEEKIESTVILSEVKNLIENNVTDSSHFDSQPAGQAGLSVTDNSGENKNIVLVVEDNADVREFIKDALGNEFQIEEAANGEQGVRKAEQIIPDLIISDLMMPTMGGNELTRRIKNDERTSHIPIILLTAKSEQESKLEGLETGADDYLTKPFDTKELRIRINNLISMRRKLQERYSKADFVPVKNAEENLSRSVEAKAEKLSDLDEKFMSKVMEVIESHIAEEEFSIEEFDKEIGMGRVQIYRKVKALTGKSPSRYIRSIRLSRAKQLIEENKGNISEIAYSVGFSSPQYFTRCFKEEFGFPPSDLIN
jgi:signal transduction histidine kinase/ligand-binding sensor domain-containing protein/DNA-binding response OmpR family regulator